MNIGIGEERTIVPNVKANPPAKISWYSPSGEELSHDELKVKGEPGQDGVYKVVAENQYGKDEVTVKVSIKSIAQKTHICICISGAFAVTAFAFAQ